MLSRRSARRAYAALNGICCVYKPPGLSVLQVKDVIKGNLQRDLNAMDYVPHTSSSVPMTTGVPTVITPEVRHLVFGNRYEKDDIAIALLHNSGRHASGLTVFAINRGCSRLHAIRDAKLLRVYRVAGQLGIATDNYSEKGRILEKISFGHVTHSKMDRVCSALQAVHLKEQYRYAGVDLQSQEAYELAAAGSVRPAPDVKTPQLLYGVKCIAFEPPSFTLEIHCINESTVALMELIHNVGVQLKSAAVCTSVRCVRYGPLTLADALTRHQWTYDELVANMYACQRSLMSGLAVPQQLVRRQLVRPAGDS